MFLYNICFFIFALFYLPVFLLKGKHKDGLAERFGFVPRQTREKLRGQRVVWVHGVSVGEIVQAFRLMEALKKRWSGVRFVVTTTTAAGKEVAMKLKAKEDEALYFPVDFRSSVNRFIRALEPKALILIETEIWPNLLSELSKRRVPAFILNGRISDKAVSGYRRIRSFLAPILKRLRAVAVQDEGMRQRFLDLGAEPSGVFVTGNMKFDWQPHLSEERLVGVFQKTHSAGEFLVVAGSTHEGEESAMLGVYEFIHRSHENIKLVIAPRHLDRLASVEREAAGMGLASVRISGLNGTPPESRKTVYLLDVMGVLADFYRIADVVFVGGSLVPVGGHNLAEAAYFEKPVIFGPHMNNFSQMAEEFKKHSAGLEVKTEGELKKELVNLLENRGLAHRLGKNARELVRRHEGATERNVTLLLKHLGDKP